MARSENTSAVIDGVLRILVTGSALSMAILIPNTVQGLDKPLAKYFARFDNRAREREYRRLVRYMRQQGLIRIRAKDYEHGLVITKAGRQRIEKINLNQIEITHPARWDKKWRLIFFDIPESQRFNRFTFTSKMKELGLRQLQQSVWIFPYPCRPEIEILSHHLQINRFITYIETDFIDAQEKPKDRFTFKF